MTFVLVPGAGGDSWYWHLVAPLLEAAGHDAIMVDLPAGDEEEAGLSAYAGAIVAAAGDAEDVVLVAQSLGGFSAPLAAEPLSASRIVLVNAMVPTPGETFNEWWGAVGQQNASRAYAARDGRDPDAPFDLREAFFHDVPPEVTDSVLARGAPRAEATIAEQPWPLGTWPDVPTSAITGRHDRFFPEELQRRYLGDRLGIEPTVIDGGHLVALANPEGLVATLLEHVD